VNLLLVYFVFFKIGIFAVGGGLATLPFLFQMADRYDWLTREMVGNFLAIAQSSPGAVGVNMAAQTGFQYGGIAGAYLAALGLVSPAIAVICAAARMLQKFRENSIVVSVFAGLRPAAAGLLASAGFGVWKLALYNEGAASWQECIRWKEAALFAAIFLLIFRLKGHPVIYIALGAAAGVLLRL
jgi:chromate transporter